MHTQGCFAWLAATLLLAGCGARPDLLENEELGVPAGASAGAAGVAGSAGKGGGASSTPGAPLPNQELPECIPGFEPALQPHRRCTWLTEAGQCFDERSGACACACPRDRNSVCWSPFPRGPGAATLVRCE